MRSYVLSFIIIFFSTAFVIWEQPQDARKETGTTKPGIFLQAGDIIFQSSSGGQGKAIQIATGSTYNHCGLLYMKNGGIYVLEANGPVGLTEFTKFINRGNGRYVIKRLANTDSSFTDTLHRVLQTEAAKYIGTNYDWYFGWNDSLMYCSELVWKIYDRAFGLQVGQLQQLKDFNLTNPVVQAKLKERFGENIPYDEKVISPASIFNSKLLKTVEEN